MAGNHREPAPARQLPSSGTTGAVEGGDEEGEEDIVPEPDFEVIVDERPTPGANI